MKDIVAERSIYFPDKETHSLAVETESIYPAPFRACVPGTSPLIGITANSFNIPRFIPLLRERIQVISAPGRIFVIQWIFLLQTIPDLELISYLPEFLDGLFNYLSDPNIDVRTATLNLLSEFLKEMAIISSNNKIDDIIPSDSASHVTNLKHKIPLDFGKMTEILVLYIQSSGTLFLIKTKKRNRLLLVGSMNSFVFPAPIY